MELDKNEVTTDDLAFSAYMRMKGYPLITSHQTNGKFTFTFDICQGDGETLKVEFINSQFLRYYNELRNLKKLF